VLPVTVAVNCWVWVTFKFCVAGLTATTINTARSIVFDVPPPGLGVTTVTGSVPALARIAAGRCANSSEELVNVVAKGLPLA
jgi:hypothetical protein